MGGPQLAGVPSRRNLGRPGIARRWRPSCPLWRVSAGALPGAWGAWAGTRGGVQVVWGSVRGLSALPRSMVGALFPPFSWLGPTSLFVSGGGGPGHLRGVVCGSLGRKGGGGVAEDVADALQAGRPAQAPAHRSWSQADLYQCKGLWWPQTTHGGRVL